MGPEGWWGGVCLSSRHWRSRVMPLARDSEWGGGAAASGGGLSSGLSRRSPGSGGGDAFWSCGQQEVLRWVSLAHILLWKRKGPALVLEVLASSRWLIAPS